MVGAAFGLLPLAGLGTAIAEAPAPAASSSPSTPPAPSAPTSPSPCTVLNGCLASPTASPTPEPVPTTASPTPKPVPTATATVKPRSTYSPKPRSTYSPEPVSTASPVTGGVDVGTITVPTDSPTPTPVAAKPAAEQTTASDRISTYVALAVGGAVVLGAGGAAGLYLTRHRHEH